MNTLKNGLCLVATEALSGDEYPLESVILLINGDQGGWLGVNIAGSSVNCQHWLVDAGPVPTPLMLLTSVSNKPDSLPVGDTGYAIFQLDVGISLEEAKAAMVQHMTIRPRSSLALMGCILWECADLSRQIEEGLWRVGALSIDRLLASPVDGRWRLATELLDEVSRAGLDA